MLAKSCKYYKLRRLVKLIDIMHCRHITVKHTQYVEGPFEFYNFENWFAGRYAGLCIW